MKTCSSCKQSKPLEEFSKDCTKPDGLQCRCKPCSQATVRATALKHKEKYAVGKADWYQRNKVKILAHYADPARKAARAQTTKEWNETHPERRREISEKHRVAHPENTRWGNFNRRLRRWGLTIDSYHARIESQNFSCPICAVVPETTGTHDSIDGFHFDHDHVVECFRALLCKNCNVALGQLRDSPEIARKAASYLEYYHARRPAALVSAAS